MFTAPLSTITKAWKEPKCPSTNEWIKKICGIYNMYTMEYYSATIKNETLPFTTQWMELESIMLNEISQSE
ncbi:LORF2 protein, partial [Crocuta crocuta]